MRLAAVQISGLGVAAALMASACAPVEPGVIDVARVQVDSIGVRPVLAPEVVRVDPEQAAERALVGGVVGGLLGAGVGAAAASFNPPFGAWVGGAAGVALGTAIGVATTPPLPDYTPVAVPASPEIPRFYDTWPPGYRSPPAGTRVPPPPPEWSPAFEAKLKRGWDDVPAVGDPIPLAASPAAPL
ncbi:MAG: hypothetical protein AB7H71_09825 [Alphaproteobacteria bacterium]